MQRSGHVDGFQFLTGVLAVIAGPILLLRGAPAGWSFLLLAAGLVLLVTQWAIVYDIEVDATDRTPLVLAVVASLCVAVAVVYLTRAANDLPSLFPGHDGDSENFRIVPGLILLTVAAVMLGRAVVELRPRRAHH